MLVCFTDWLHNNAVHGSPAKTPIAGPDTSTLTDCQNQTDMAIPVP